MGMRMGRAVATIGLILLPGGLAGQSAAAPTASAGTGARADGAEVASSRPPVFASDSSRASLFAHDFRSGLRGTLGTLAAPRHWSRGEWLAVPALAVGLASLSGVDEPLQGAIDRNRTRAEDRALLRIEPLGAQYGLALVVGTYAAGLALERPGLRRTGVEAATSVVVAAGLVTPALKWAVGRTRPRNEKGAFAFYPGSGNESFPSGHTTNAFAVASVFAAEVRPTWAKAGIYGLAGGVAAARLAHDAHFLSDVVAGAIIGTVTGRSVVRRERRQAQGGLTPYLGGEGVGVQLRF